MNARTAPEGRPLIAIQSLPARPDARRRLVGVLRDVLGRIVAAAEELAAGDFEEARSLLADLEADLAALVAAEETA